MAKIQIERFSEGSFSPCPDEVAGEEPLQITVDGFPVAVVMRTPGHDEELVSGFLLTEGVVGSLGEVRRIDTEDQNHARVFLEDDVELDRARLSRNLFSASSCGICGKATIDSVRQQHERIEGGSYPADRLLDFPAKLRAAQETFGRTGGLHAAGLFDDEGELLVAREDVGRHNAIDKVIGWAAKENPTGTALMVSGRVSFEVMQKALAGRIALVAAISAPTSLAVEFGQESGQTLVGFLRPPSFNVYAGLGRLRR
ncbi:MAG: formate dehydrogenase accessory sulfurtransferase FdhD [Verrucomicrobiota bacterium JB023]|nr:formate dehydrogenase accessory sulfurtransferase FdhD [Verrucomicrobiota bacterium JB023]